MQILLCILCLAATLQGSVLQEEIGSCSTVQCPEKQMCIEEVKSCPEDQPDCDSRPLEPLCVTMENSRSPSSCDDLVCAQSRSCFVLQTADGTKATCKDVPTSCEEVDCDDGMLCVERVKPRCIPIRTEVVPLNCSQLECPENLICMVLDGNRGARCAKPPVPTSCEELDCPADLTCKVIKGTRQAKCIQEENNLPTNQQKVSISRDCTGLECDDGYNCKLVISRRMNRSMLPVATCVPTECPIRRKPRPPVSCSEIECRDNEVCMVCGKGINTRARCINTTRQDDTIQSDDTELTIQGRPPIGCDELICEPLEVEKCQELSLNNGRKQIVLCVPNDAPDNCKDAQCDNETETCLELEDGQVKTAVCVPTRISNSLPTSSNGVATQPITTNQPRIQNDRQPSTPAQSCEQLDCGRDSECLQVIKNGEKRATCLKLKNNEECIVEEEGTVSKSTVTVRLNLPDVCQERRCCDGERCVVQRNANGDSPVAVCAPVNTEENQLPVVQPLSCEELMCAEGSECIIKQGEGGVGGRRGAVCKRSRIDSPDTSRPDSGERTRSGNRRRPSSISDGRSNSN